MEHLNIGVIGAGRVGAVLAARFQAAGHTITAVSGRSDSSALRVQTLISGTPVRTPSDVADSCDVLLIAVPDDALFSVVARLSVADVIKPGDVVVHTSGRHGVASLHELTRIGARPIAMHPAMTFTGTPVDVDRECVFGVTAADADREIAERLVSDLHGDIAWIAETDRVLYHAALTHGANHLITLVSQSIAMLHKAGAAEPEAVLRPLLTAALGNVLDYGDAALTGPVVRGDAATVKAHLESFALAHVSESTMTTYRELARATAGLAARDGRLDNLAARDVVRVLDDADWDAMAVIARGI